MANDAPETLSIASCKDGTIVSVHVQPRASRIELCGIHAGELKVRLTSPPVDDAANRQLEAFIASTLGIAKSKVSVTSGLKSRHKRLLIRGSDPDSIASFFNEQA